MTCSNYVDVTAYIYYLLVSSFALAILASSLQIARKQGCLTESYDADKQKCEEFCLPLPNGTAHCAG